jgi:hypothetical protein
MAAEDGLQLHDLTLPSERVEVMRHGHEVRFRRQRVARMPPIAIGENPELSGFDQTPDARLHV